MCLLSLNPSQNLSLNPNPNLNPNQNWAMNCATSPLRTKMQSLNPTRWTM